MRKYLCIGATAIMAYLPITPQQPQQLNVYGNQIHIRPGPAGTVMMEYDTNQDNKGDTLFIYVPVKKNEETKAISLELLGRYNDKNNDGKYSLDELTKREFEKKKETQEF